MQKFWGNILPAYSGKNTFILNTFIPIYQTTLRHITVDRTLNVNYWLETAKSRGDCPITQAPRVRSQVRSCGICGGRSTGAGFLQILRFPLPILIPPSSLYSSIFWGWYKCVPNGLSLTPLTQLKKKSCGWWNDDAQGFPCSVYWYILLWPMSANSKSLSLANSIRLNRMATREGRNLGRYTEGGTIPARVIM
jgi:hypothetical protein